MRQCKNCDRPIGNLERAFAWEGAIICGPCHAKLSAPHIVGSDQVFDSLEDLAKVTPKTLQSSHTKKDSINISQKKLFAIVAILLVALIAFAIWRSNEREMDAGFGDAGLSGDNAQNLPDLSPSDARILGLASTGKNNAPDPEFSISSRSYSGENVATGGGWEVTNESQSPLTISRFNINAEFDAPIGYAPFPSWICKDNSKSLPITLTIGESVTFEQWSIFYPNDPQYTKQEIFIDIDTDRGNFRYQGYGFQKR